MATVTPPTNGTLKSNTLENSFYEALSICRNYELDTAKNTSNFNNVTISIDQTNRRCSGGFSFNFNITTNTTDGSANFPVTDYFTSAGYAAGTGGTFKSPNLPAVITEIARAIQIKEFDTTKNPQGLNAITSLNYDTETRVVTCNFDFALDVTVDASGSVVFKAKTYLAD